MGTVESREGEQQQEEEQEIEIEGDDIDVGSAAKAEAHHGGGGGHAVDSVARRLAPASDAVVDCGSVFHDCRETGVAAEMDLGDALVMSLRHNATRIAF